MNIAVQIDHQPGTPSGVEYRWDADTEILTANVDEAGAPKAGGASGSLGLEGSDGSWVILDVAGGQIKGVEVAVWPDVRKRRSLAPPPEVEDACVSLPDAGDDGAVTSLEMDTSLIAESDPAERTIHFRVGRPRRVKTVRIARDLLIDVDSRSRIAGVWLLNVPPCPEIA